MRALSQSVGKPPKVIAKVVSSYKQICVLSELLLLVYSVCLLLPDFNERTRVSENALLPALVTEQFAYTHRISTFSKALQYQPDRASIVKAQLETFGITAQLQPFQVHFPYMKRSGMNVVAVVRAGRSRAVESMLAAVSLDSSSVEAIAMVIAFASYAREQLYWARDLLFVFVDGGTVGMEAFLSAYHGLSRPFINATRIRIHSGPIIGAFVMKTTGTSFANLDIEYNMMKGQLPNLDLINLMVRLADKFSLTTSIFNRTQDSSLWGTSAIALSGVFAQAFSSQQGLHSVFSLYGISALTVHAKGNGHGSLTSLARICEGIFRSLNNIVERFHQSYFMYLLLSPRRFISVAYYMPAIGLALLPLIVLSLKEWFSLVRLSVPSFYLVFHLGGLASYMLATAFTASPLFSKAVLLSTLQLFVPFYAFVPSLRSSKRLRCGRFLLYLEFCLLAGSVSLLNFSLALVLSVISVPIILLVLLTPHSRTMNQLKYIFGFLVHPLMILAYWQHAVYPDTGLEDLYGCVRDSLQEHLLFGSFVFPILHVFLVPLWNMCLYLAVVDVQ